METHFKQLFSKKVYYFNIEHFDGTFSQLISPMPHKPMQVMKATIKNRVVLKA